MSELGEDFDDGEEITGYLVDEQGDSEQYKGSRFYTAKGNPVRYRKRAKGPTSFSVSSADLFDKQKNPNLSLSPRDIARNPKIRKANVPQE